MVEGDGATTDLPRPGLDHALFTGGTEIGKRSWKVPPRHRTPVTFRAGRQEPRGDPVRRRSGKLARRILWVKFNRARPASHPTTSWRRIRSNRHSSMHCVKFSSNCGRENRPAAHRQRTPVQPDRRLPRFDEADPSSPEAAPTWRRSPSSPPSSMNRPHRSGDDRRDRPGPSGVGHRRMPKPP